MRNLVGVLAIGVLSVTMSADVGLAERMAGEGVAASIEALWDGRIVDCGLEWTCLAAKHRIENTGPVGDWAGPHQCWAPATHSGPPCNPTFVTADELRRMTRDEALAYASRKEGNVVLNVRWNALDVLSCTGEVIVARVPLEYLAE